MNKVLLIIGSHDYGGLLWRNYKEEYFGPSPELPCAADFKKLYEAENTLFLKEIEKIK